jgi:hypothetical protein
VRKNRPIDRFVGICGQISGKSGELMIFLNEENTLKKNLRY